MPTFTVSAAEAGQTVLQLLRAHMTLSWSKARRLVHEERVLLAGKPCVDSARRVKRGQRLEVRDRLSSQPAPAPASKLTIRYVDAHVVVVDKPPGLTTMRHPDEAAEFGARGRRFLPPTLADLLPAELARLYPGQSPAVRAVHRLDKDTSGLVVFARTVEAERHLGKQFRAHTIERRYIALVRGQARAQRIESTIANDRGDHRRGSVTAPGQGKRAVTRVHVIQALGDYTLVECRLETGRTHQVRIHLGEAGTPICGDHVYDRPLHGKPIADNSGVSRLALHAASLGFVHPKTGKQLLWHSSMPKDLRDVIIRLQKTWKSS